MRNESGKSLVEMLAVLALIGIISIGGIFGYQSANASHKANQITELVSIASMTGKTKMKNYNNSTIWRTIGKNNDDYKCISSLSVDLNGKVEIGFGSDSDCQTVKQRATSQWGSRWDESSKTYTPPQNNAI